MKNNLFIFFPPGLGGHHLANILSLTGNYTYSVDYSKYFFDQPSEPAFIRGFNAHFKNSTNEETIYLCHFGSANDSKIMELINHPNTQFLVIHLPNKNILARWRFQLWNNIDLEKHHAAVDLEKIYKPQILKTIYPANWQVIMADDFFDDSNIDQFLNKLENILNVKILDKEFARRIHAQWILRLQNHYQQLNSIEMSR